MDTNLRKLALIQNFMSLSDPRTVSDFGRKSLSDWIIRHEGSLSSTIVTQELNQPVKGLLITPEEKKPQPC